MTYDNIGLKQFYGIYKVSGLGLPSVLTSPQVGHVQSEIKSKRAGSIIIPESWTTAQFINEFIKLTNKDSLQCRWRCECVAFYPAFKTEELSCYQ